MKSYFVFGCCVICLLSSERAVRSAPVRKTGVTAFQEPFAIKQTRQWIVEAVYRIDLNFIARQDLGWLVVELQPDVAGKEIVEEQGVMRNGVSYAVPHSQTKPLFKGKYRVLANFGAISRGDGKYRLESNFPHFRMGSLRSYYDVDAEPLLYGGIALMRIDEKSNQPSLPVVALPPEWVDDVEKAVEDKRQHPIQDQVTSRTIVQLFDLLHSSSPLQSFPIFKQLLAVVIQADEKQRETLRTAFLTAGGLKRAVWLTYIIQSQLSEAVDVSTIERLNSIFDKKLAQEVAEEVSAEDAISLLAAMQVAGVYDRPEYPSAFSLNLLHEINAQVRFKRQDEAGKQLSQLLAELNVAK